MEVQIIWLSTKNVQPEIKNVSSVVISVTTENIVKQLKRIILDLETTLRKSFKTQKNRRLTIPDISMMLMIVFQIDEDDGLVTAIVGGVPIELLIDSGSKCNLLINKT